MISYVDIIDLEGDPRQATFLTFGHKSCHGCSARSQPQVPGTRSSSYSPLQNASYRDVSSHGFSHLNFVGPSGTEHLDIINHMRLIPRTLAHIFSPCD